LQTTDAIEGALVQFAAQASRILLGEVRGGGQARREGDEEGARETKRKRFSVHMELLAAAEAASITTCPGSVRTDHAIDPIASKD
jgi:hypothetical protein